MLLPSVTGWFVGLAWRAEVLPGVSMNWRVPAWVVGERERVSRRGEEGRFEDLRRRLEGEVAAGAGAASGVSNGDESGDNEQRQRQRGSQ